MCDSESDTFEDDNNKENVESFIEHTVGNLQTRLKEKNLQLKKSSITNIKKNEMEKAELDFMKAMKTYTQNDPEDEADECHLFGIVVPAELRKPNTTEQIIASSRLAIYCKYMFYVLLN